MKRRVLCTAMAMILCLALMPVYAFAEEPLFEAEIIKTSLQANMIFDVTEDGLVQYEIWDSDANTTEAGLINAKGEYVYVRYPEWRYSNESEEYEYQYLLGDFIYSFGNYIFDGNDCRRYAKYSSTQYSDYEDNGLYWYSDYKIVSKKDGKIYYCSDIIAKYLGCNAGEIDIYDCNVSEDEKCAVIDAVRMDSEYNTLREDYYYIDISNLKVKMVISDKIDGESAYMTPLSDGLIRYSVYDYENDRYKKYGFMDKNGKKVFSIDVNQYSHCRMFSSGLAAVEAVNSEKQGFIDKSGKLVIPCIYKYVGDFEGNYACVCNSMGKYGVIDKSGNTVMPFQWDYLRNGGDNELYIAENYDDDRGYLLIDKNGTELVYNCYDLTPCRNGTAYALGNDYSLYVINITPNTGSGSVDVSSIFKDVPSNAWYKSFLQNAYDNNIVTGMSADMYGPQKNLTHAQIIVMVAKLHSLQKGDDYDFYAPGVTGNHWCSPFLNYCKAEGIIDSRFDNVLNNNVNRGEMAYYFANALTSNSYSAEKNVNFTDVSGNPYVASINKLAAASIVSGYNDGSYKPENLVTRAEATVFVSKIIDLIY